MRLRSPNESTDDGESVLFLDLQGIEFDNNFAEKGVRAEECLPRSPSRPGFLRAIVYSLAIAHARVCCNEQHYVTPADGGMGLHSPVESIPSFKAERLSWGACKDAVERTSHVFTSSRKILALQQSPQPTCVGESLDANVSLLPRPSQFCTTIDGFSSYSPSLAVTGPQRLHAVLST